MAGVRTTRRVGEEGGTKRSQKKARAKGSVRPNQIPAPSICITDDERERVTLYPTGAGLTRFCSSSQVWLRLKRLTSRCEDNDSDVWPLHESENLSNFLFLIFQGKEVFFLYTI